MWVSARPVAHLPGAGIPGLGPGRQLGGLPGTHLPPPADLPHLCPRSLQPPLNLCTSLAGLGEDGAGHRACAQELFVKRVMERHGDREAGKGSLPLSSGSLCAESPWLQHIPALAPWPPDTPPWALVLLPCKMKIAIVSAV